MCCNPGSRCGIINGNCSNENTDEVKDYEMDPVTDKDDK